MKVRNYLPLFEILVSGTDEQRGALIRTLSELQLRAILEAVYNVLKGTCPIKGKDKKKLAKYKSVIRRLVSKDLTRLQQRRLLTKHRTLLPLVLSPVVEAWKHVDR